MANMTHVQWQALAIEEQNFYQEFNCPIINNIRQIPGNEDLIYYGYCVPTEAHINSVCDTGDNLVRSINFRLTPGQQNSIIAWIEEHMPNHPYPIIN
jgi:hypothetical protein